MRSPPPHLYLHEVRLAHVRRLDLLDMEVVETLLRPVAGIPRPYTRVEPPGVRIHPDAAAVLVQARSSAGGAARYDLLAHGRHPVTGHHPLCSVAVYLVEPAPVVHICYGIRDLVCKLRIGVGIEGYVPLLKIRDLLPLRMDGGPGAECAAHKAGVAIWRLLGES